MRCLFLFVQLEMELAILFEVYSTQLFGGKAVKMGLEEVIKPFIYSILDLFPPFLSISNSPDNRATKCSFSTLFFSASAKGEL